MDNHIRLLNNKHNRNDLHNNIIFDHNIDDIQSQIQKIQDKFEQIETRTKIGINIWQAIQKLQVFHIDHDG